MFLKFKKNISYINFGISITALLFQINILNPWHGTISNQINRLELKIKNLEKNN